MVPDYVLQRYPDRVLPWLRARLGLNRAALAQRLGAPVEMVGRWERGQRPVALAHHRRLVTLLARALATEEGAAFARSLVEEAVDGRDG